MIALRSADFADDAIADDGSTRYGDGALGTATGRPRRSAKA